jgi:hypothetical protein
MPTDSWPASADDGAREVVLALGGTAETPHPTLGTLAQSGAMHGVADGRASARAATTTDVALAPVRSGHWFMTRTPVIGSAMSLTPSRPTYQ